MCEGVRGVCDPLSVDTNEQDTRFYTQGFQLGKKKQEH